MRWLASVLCILLAGGVSGSLLTGQMEKTDVQIGRKLTREDLQKEAAKHFKRPVDAVVSKAGKPNVIPELNGIELDIETTWARFMEHGEEVPVRYVYKQIEPKVKMTDYPNLPVYQGNPEKNQMALMINVAWGTEHLDGILQVLKANKVKATFFLDGSWLAKNQEVAKRIVAEGHEIGNHAYSHPNMAALSPDQQKQQIVKTQELIRTELAVDSKWFAPPSGSYNEMTVRLAREQGMGTVLWTLDTVDWHKPPKESIINRILPKARNGAMVLMHPTEPTLDALRIMIPELKKKQFKLVTVSELLSPIREVE
ncbi:polysaccharide deacetylase family protein [Effusibacillus lacus]|uniref:NodB homology domain-containing protein n=1 Tax=Effusibacillus lacus TaxID=1348429 RepID=A0A292YHV3_9BACL|nr:polysaccharide deacetylase family protein [Effusibacillus lacus]TCS73173.1 putative sporulation protein (polysaccharide deacetylase family) [Effusibacillus lacus]GAX90577.1 hypothetical protein EFBL_2204 [Effusibacillus lacus]